MTHSGHPLFTAYLVHSIHQLHDGGFEAQFQFVAVAEELSGGARRFRASSGLDALGNDPCGGITEPIRLTSALPLSSLSFFFFPSVWLPDAS